MFFCRRNPLLKLLLMVLGLKFIKRERWSEDEKASYRAKRRAFRQKMREAFDVWDNPVDPAASTESSNATDASSAE